MPTTLPVRRTLVLFLSLIAMLALSYARTGALVPGASAVGATTTPFSCNGTRFYLSAGVGTIFHQGDTWAGGTFTYIENNNYIEVRDNPDSAPSGMIVGEFNQPKRLGDQVTITFATDIHISGIYWYDNDPKSPPEVPVAEAGWSFMGTPGPLTGDKQAVWTTENITTNSVSYSAGDDSGGIDFCFTPVRMGGGQGCTPGYWKNHLAAWGPSGYSPNQTLESVFDVPDSLAMDNVTLVTALQGGGGPGVSGAAVILRRAATASLLNAAHTGVSFGYTTGQVISQTNAALATLNRDTMLALATTLDNANNGQAGCPLN